MWCILLHGNGMLTLAAIKLAGVINIYGLKICKQRGLPLVCKFVSAYCCLFFLSFPPFSLLSPPPAEPLSVFHVLSVKSSPNFQC